MAADRDVAQYARFLPAHYRTEPVAQPVSTWWAWRGREVHIARVVVPDSATRVLHGAGGYSGA